MINIEQLLFEVLEINCKTDDEGSLDNTNNFGLDLGCKVTNWHNLYKRKLAIEFLLNHHDKGKSLIEIEEALKLDEKMFNEKYKEEQDDE